MFSKMKKYAVGLTAAAGASVLASPAFAIDTLAVDTAIQAAEGDALLVGGYVIAAVAALVVIGLVIGIVKKI